MNKIEKVVYNLVKSNPRLKSFIRNIYQSVFDLLPDRDNWSSATIIEKKGYFLGFHDKSPFSFDEQYVLANKIEIPLRMPQKDDLLTVGFWNNELEQYTPVLKTYAWNYHKGCRLQWLGDNTHSFIFNNIVNGKLGANIYSIDNGETRELDYPIDTVSHNGKFATSFSYERLNRYMPGYGYCYEDEPYFDEYESENTGLFLIDIENNTRKLLISLKQLAMMQPDETMRNAHHYVTHTEFSTDDDRVAFLHRWTYEDPDKRYTRLVTCKLDGTDIHISITSGMVSHYDWDKEHGILAYCQVNGVDGHYIFKDYKMKEVKRVAPDLNSDGHQSYIPNTDFFVTDTYPDKWRHAKIYKVDIKNNKTELLADLKSPKAFQSPNIYKHWACDLHPRVSPDGKYVCFDSVHSGERSFCVMKIGNTKI